MTVNILGTEYTIRFIPEEEDDILKDYDGYCDETVKEVVVKKYKRGEPETKSQGLFHQIQKEVTFCGLPHGAYA